MDAASTRVVGDPKIPVPSYTAKAKTGTAQDYIDRATAYFDNYLDPTAQKLAALDPKFAALENQQTITQAQYDALNSERDAIRNYYNINGVPVATAIVESFASLPASEQATINGTEFSVSAISAKIQTTLALSTQQKERLYALQSKIEGRGEGE